MHPGRGARSTLTISSAFGAATTQMYMYDFRQSHQAGGLFHFTLVTESVRALAATIQWADIATAALPVWCGC